MYYFQVEKGKEERTARSLRKQYPEVEFTVPKKKMVGSDRETTLLPGIVFADRGEAELLKTYRMKIVSSQEERRIARLSDRTPSVAEYDGEHLHFTEGPLVGSDAFVKRVNTTRGSVLLNMKLLGVFWDIWLECAINEVAPEKGEEKLVSATGSSGIRNYQSSFDWEKALAEQQAAREAADQEAAENEPEEPEDENAGEGEQLVMDLGDGPISEAAPKTKKNRAQPEFTEEEKKRILERAEVYGVRTAAEEAGIPWQTIAWWKRKAPVEEKKFEEPTAASREENQRKILARAEMVGIHQAAKEAGVPWQTLAWWKKKMAAAEAAETAESTAAAGAETGEPVREAAPRKPGRRISVKPVEIPELDPEEAARRQAVLARAEEVGVRQAANEAGVSWQTVSWWKRKMAQQEEALDESDEESADAAESGFPGDTDEDAASSDDPAALQRENQRLRERVAELEKKLKRVKQALREMAEM